MNKLSFWFLGFGHFCSKFKLFASEYIWFQFYYYFCSKVKSIHIYLIKSCYFIIFLRGKRSFLFYLKGLFIL
ncbi:hypothetical protein Hanom_Chr15g01380851 [Helianthus anomalus]